MGGFGCALGCPWSPQSGERAQMTLPGIEPATLPKTADVTAARPMSYPAIALGEGRGLNPRGCHLGPLSKMVLGCGLVTVQSLGGRGWLKPCGIVQIQSITDAWPCAMLVSCDANLQLLKHRHAKRGVLRSTSSSTALPMMAPPSAIRDFCFSSAQTANKSSTRA